MPYLIVPNFYASKSLFFADEANVHAVSYSKCNFSCGFCCFSSLKEENSYYNKDLQQFKKKVVELLEKGKAFKFTGGEPTLNPDLFDLLRIIREQGGRTYLDTNASNLNVMKKIVDARLIDVLGVSLKGLCEEEALQCTGISNSALCWANVLENIKYACNQGVPEVIVTYVCFEDFTYEKLCKFALIFNDNPRVLLKLNNFQKHKYPCKETREPMNIESLQNIINEFVNNNAAWKNRILFIKDSSGVSDASGIIRY